MIGYLQKMPEWLRNSLIGVVAFLAGFFSNQYVAYRTSFRESLSANYQQFNDAAAQIESSLKEFADIARGARPKSENDATELQLRLLKAVGAAEDLQRRIGASTDVVSSYRTAAVALKHASDEIEGPANGKSLVVAVSGYLLAEKSLRDAVIKRHNAFF